MPPEVAQVPLPSLRAYAVAALGAADLDLKVHLTRDCAKAWCERRLSLRLPQDPSTPDRPGRPAAPVLVHPKRVARRSLTSERGRIALIHALAHIELNAVDLALDICARFASEDMPRSFFDGWIGVADDEARHFCLLRQRLNDLGADYGDLSAHDGLWQAATNTRGDLGARLAIVPLVLEARGLDVTPSLIEKLETVGDRPTAAILRIIYEDEKNTWPSAQNGFVSGVRATACTRQIASSSSCAPTFTATSSHLSMSWPVLQRA